MTLEPVALGRQRAPGVLFEQGELLIPSDTRRKRRASLALTAETRLNIALRHEARYSIKRFSLFGRPSLLTVQDHF